MHTVYIKPELSTIVSNKKITIGDICQVYCYEDALAKEVRNLDLFRIEKQEKKKISISTLYLIRYISDRKPGILVINLGEADFIVEYQKSENAVVLLVSHSMEDVARVADNVLVMNGGRLAMFGKTQEVFSRGKELEKMGLAVPSIMKIVSALREKGVNLPDGILNVTDAKDALLHLLKGGEPNA